MLYGLVRGMLLPSSREPSHVTVWKCGTELRHCNYAVDHLAVDEESPADVDEDLAVDEESPADVDEDLAVDEESPADVDEESPADVDEPDGSAYAMPGVVAMATPTPRVTANAPTRPMCLA